MGDLVDHIYAVRLSNVVDGPNLVLNLELLQLLVVLLLEVLVLLNDLCLVVLVLLLHFSFLV